MLSSNRNQTLHFNPYHTTGLFLYPLKALETSVFLIISEDIERDQWHTMGPSLYFDYYFSIQY